MHASCNSWKTNIGETKKQKIKERGLREKYDRNERVAQKRKKEKILKANLKGVRLKVAFGRLFRDVDSKMNG